MLGDSQSIPETKPTHRSRVTNGSELLPGVDGRSSWARRCRDLIEIHIADLGGEAAISSAEKNIVRRAATLTVELERMETEFASKGAASIADLDAYQRASNTLRRLLETLGLERRSKDVTPDLSRYIAEKAA